jgi:hypothetical protein
MRGRLSYTLATSLFAISISACGTSTAELTPGPGAMPSPDMDGAAFAEFAGVRINAAPDRWTGEPENLDTEVTPVLVRIENTSLRPVIIRYQNFEFKDPGGRNYQAIPPYKIDETMTESVTVPAYEWSGFAVAPHLSRYYGGRRAWADPFYYDSGWFNDRYTVWRRVELPTADMVSMALPEGVLEPGGIAEGFIYFDLKDDDTPITFSMNLVTPGGINFGKIQIPFTVD